MPQIAVLNKSTVLTDAVVAAAVPDFALQLSRDFLPAWGLTASVDFFAEGQEIPAAAWQVLVLDDSDQAGALGYHDLTASGQPQGKVFAKTDLDNSLSWTVTMSHELLEMVADPDLVLCAQVGDKSFASVEVCDPCEADCYGYLINATIVSDFILPSWYQPNATGPFDFAHHHDAPLTLLPGGYVSIWTPEGNWSQKTAANEAPSRAPTSQRMEMRNRPLVRSTGTNGTRSTPLADLL
jgi:hypothetical protein